MRNQRGRECVSMADARADGFNEYRYAYGMQKQVSIYGDCSRDRKRRGLALRRAACNRLLCVAVFFL